MALLGSMATIGGFTLLSRILGFVRDILIASALGASLVADAFFVAFKLPNMFRRLFAEGAFNAAFVPQLSGLLEQRGQAGAKEFAQRALSVLLFILLIFTALVQLFMPFLMQGLAPGFVSRPDQFDLAVLLTRITFPYLLFISLVSLMGGLLNSLGRFWAAAATPNLLNLSLIGCVLWLAPLTPTPAHALAWGVALAGLVQFFWLFFHCGRAGYWLCLPRPRLTADMRLMIRRIVPGAIGAGIYQINLVVDMIIASFLPAGSISYLFFADRVTQLPLGIIGVGVGTALLPLMSRQLGAGNEGGARDSQNRALEFALFLSLPAAAALMVIAHPVIAILFERGAFTSVQTAATAPALAIYAMGLPAYILVKGLTPGFFARGDTLTPMKLAALAAAVNLVMAISLAMIFKHLGIAMATALSSWLNVILLAWALKRRGFLAPDQRLLGKLWRIIATSALMVALLVYLMDVLDVWLAGNMGARIGGLTMLIGAGFVAYMLLTRLAGCWTLGELKTLLGREAA